MDAQSYGEFSINERMIGDQPDYVNFIDSETGSFAHCLEVRRAVSQTFARLHLCLDPNLNINKIISHFYV